MKTTKKELNNYFSELEKTLNDIRSEIFDKTKDLMKISKKKLVEFGDDQPLIYHDGTSICIDRIENSKLLTVSGINDNGVRYEIDLLEIGTDDMLMILGTLQNNIL